MSPLDAFYEKNLYPLQNGVLRIAEELGSPFYLTGSTALSRGYYHHRGEYLRRKRHSVSFAAILSWSAQTRRRCAVLR